MTPSAEKRAIFKHATANLPPERTVFVQLTCLLAALGMPLARTLLPDVDFEQRLKEQEEAKKKYIDELRALRESFRQQAALGFSQATAKVKEVSQQLSEAESGKLQMPVLLGVGVGPFRDCLEQAATREAAYNAEPA